MRRLMWFSIGFAAAMAVAAYLLQGQGLLILSFVLLICGLTLLAFSGDKAHIVRLILFGCAAALAWMWLFDVFYLSSLREMDNQDVVLSVEIDQFSEPTDYGITADGSVEIDGKRYSIRIYSYESMELKPGDRVEGEFSLRFTAGSAQEDIYYSGNGIYLVGYLREGTVVHTGELRLRHYPVIWRRQILTLLGKMLPDDTRPFAQALLLGEKSELDYKTNTDLSVSGIRHVVAVSGLHVSILCGIILSLLGYRRVLTPSIGIVLLILFAGVTGFTPSVVRSCVMYALMFGSIALMRDYDAPTALAFAVLIMLAVNPLAITSVSLQLSVGCVIGIFLFSKSIRNFLLSDKCLGKASVKTVMGKMKRWIADSVSVTVSTMLTTTPLCAIYFGTLSILGVLTNLLTLWMITIIFCGLLFTVVAGFVWLPLGRIICWLLSWLIRFVLWIAQTIASIPFAAVYTASPYVVIWIIFAYLLLTVFWFGKRKHPWLTVSCVTIGFCIAVGLSWLEPRLDDYRFTVLNVGQGQCILLQNKDRYYMVDCGGDSDTAVADTAAQTLLSQGINRLDGVILTHYDTDHGGALQNLLTRIPADVLYLPDLDDTGEIREGLYANNKNKICWIGENDVTEIPEMDLTIFAGSSDSSDNESSMCILFQPENCDILITGDRSSTGERDLLEQVDLPQVDVLVVGHHGAKNSAGLQLLTAVKPKTAIISVGANNQYGHPSDDVLERLSLFDCDVLRTDLDGTILIRG